MKLWDIIKRVGTAVIADSVPGGREILDLVNAALPADKKLPVTATGDQVRGALSTLPPDKQAELMNKQLDVDITQIKEDGSTLRTMLEAESKSTHTTRPKIALGCFRLVSAITLGVVGCWMYAVLTKDSVMVKEIMGGWKFVASTIFPFVIWLNQYFAVLRKESRDRLDAASGKQPTSGLLSSLIK